MSSKKIVVGMSGGVDSSVAAWLLKEQGYEVLGVTMRFWKDPYAEASFGGCLSDAATEDAKRVAEHLGIPHYVMDFQDTFKEHVVDYFTDAYTKGCTPNPCIVCNRYVKFEALLERGRELGAEYIATGHYAGIQRLPSGRFAIANSVTAAKDQTYALYRLTQDQLSRTLMPCGAYEKSRIREIAREQGIPVAGKADSQEICFIPDNDYAAFIEREMGMQFPRGNYVSLDGEILGTHQGIIHYTVGQRKGLGIAMGHPVFVTDIRPETNEVVIGEAEDVFSQVVYCKDLCFMGEASFEEEKEYLGKIRYGHRGAPCRVKRITEDILRCEFTEPVRAVTPGQALVLYDGAYVAGGGTIIRKSEALSR